MRQLEPDLSDKTINIDGEELDTKPENQNDKWKAFLAYWKSEVKKRRDLNYRVVGGDKKRFHELYQKTYSGEQLREIINFYFRHKGKEEETPTIRAALSNHTLMQYDQWKKKQ